MKFTSPASLLEGSTMGGSLLAKKNDHYTKTESDNKYALGSTLTNDYYQKTDLSTSGRSSVHWNNITNKPTYDNYRSWTLKANGETTGESITSGEALNIQGSGSTTVSRSGSNITISSTDTNNYLTGVSGNGNGTVTFSRNGLSSLTANLAHTHAISEVTGLQGALDDKETVYNVQSKMDAHKKEDAPHTYGDKFQLAFNPTFGSFELQVIGV